MKNNFENSFSLIDITCIGMPEIVKNVLYGEKKFAVLNPEKIIELAVAAVRAKEVNLLTNSALEDKILEIAEAELNKK